MKQSGLKKLLLNSEEILFKEISKISSFIFPVLDHLPSIIPFLSLLEISIISRINKFGRDIQRHRLERWMKETEDGTLSHIKWSGKPSWFHLFSENHIKRSLKSISFCTFLLRTFFQTRIKEDFSEVPLSGASRIEDPRGSGTNFSEWEEIELVYDEEKSVYLSGGTGHTSIWIEFNELNEKSREIEKDICSIFNLDTEKLIEEECFQLECLGKKCKCESKDFLVSKERNPSEFYSIINKIIYTSSDCSILENGLFIQISTDWKEMVDSMGTKTYGEDINLLLRVHKEGDVSIRLDMPACSEEIEDLLFHIEDHSVVHPYLLFLSKLVSNFPLIFFEKWFRGRKNLKFPHHISFF